MGFLAGFTLIFSVGCAHTVDVVPGLPSENILSAKKIPLDVGLYITDKFKNYKVPEFRQLIEWNYTNLGEASSAQFRLGLSQIFRTVELVDEKPPFSKPRAAILYAVIEPTIDKFDFDIPPIAFLVYPARILYKITVYDMSGKVLFTKSALGIGDTQGKGSFDPTEFPSKSASKAVEDGVNEALETILASEEIKTILKK
jgi:hypothetical protein